MQALLSIEMDYLDPHQVRALKAELPAGMSLLQTRDEARILAAAQEIEIYGGQPNKQPADILTTYDRGRMIWNGYTGAAGWLLRQSMEGVIGAQLVNNELVLPSDLDKGRGSLKINHVSRNVEVSPLSKKQYIIPHL